MTLTVIRLLEKDIPIVFHENWLLAFNVMEKKLTSGPILVALYWEDPFEMMCDASDFAVGVVVGQ